MIFLIKILLSSICFISINFNLFASNLDLEFEKNTINEHCNIVFGKLDNQLFKKLWKINKINNYSEDYFHINLKIKVTISQLKRGSKINGIRYIFYNEDGNPQLLINVDKFCSVRLSRLIIRGKNDQILSIANLSSDLKKIKSLDEFNPPLKKAQPFKGIKVAIVDTGVNYNLDFISKNISRKDSHTLLGHDFEDNDNLPYDIDIGRSEFFPMHHGTSVSSIILREAPMSELVVYRFPRSDMCKFDELIRHIALNKIKIVNLSMGSSNKNDWGCFYDAASEYKDILFFISAGNDGKNIDENKVFPASFDLENILVISSSDISGDLAQGSNFGKKSVDFLIPGEQIPVTDHRGVKTKASGSSFAVPRIVAMAVRLLSFNTDATTIDIKSTLIDRALKNENVKFGWIPDPLDNYLLN